MDKKYQSDLTHLLVDLGLNNAVCIGELLMSCEDIEDALDILINYIHSLADSILREELAITQRVHRLDFFLKNLKKWRAVKDEMYRTLAIVSNDDFLDREANKTNRTVQKEDYQETPGTLMDNQQAYAIPSTSGIQKKNSSAKSLSEIEDMLSTVMFTPNFQQQMSAIPSTSGIQTTHDDNPSTPESEKQMVKNLKACETQGEYKNQKKTPALNAKIPAENNQTPTSKSDHLQAYMTPPVSTMAQASMTQTGGTKDPASSTTREKVITPEEKPVKEADPLEGEAQQILSQIASQSHSSVNEKTTDRMKRNFFMSKILGRANSKDNKNTDRQEVGKKLSVTFENITPRKDVDKKIKSRMTPKQAAAANRIALLKHIKEEKAMRQMLYKHERERKRMEIIAIANLAAETNGATGAAIGTAADKGHTKQDKKSGNSSSKEPALKNQGNPEKVKPQDPDADYFRPATPVPSTSYALPGVDQCDKFPSHPHLEPDVFDDKTTTPTVHQGVTKKKTISICYHDGNDASRCVPITKNCKCAFYGPPARNQRYSEVLARNVQAYKRPKLINRSKILWDDDDDIPFEMIRNGLPFDIHNLDLSILDMFSYPETDCDSDEKKPTPKNDDSDDSDE